MSSHHFVKEGQEPAVFVLQPEFAVQVLVELLEWSPKVLAASSAVDILIALGIKMDVVLCAEHELSSCKEVLDFQKPVEVLASASGEDFLNDAFNYLQRQSINAVHILGNIHKIKEGFVARHDIEIVVWDGAVKWIYCASGGIKKWVTRASRFILDSRQKVEVGGSALPQCDDNGDLMVVRPDTDGFVSFNCTDRSGFWLGEYID